MKITINTAYLFMLLAGVSFFCHRKEKTYEELVQEGYIYFQKSKYNDAINKATAAINIFKNKPEAYILRGKSYFEQNRMNESFNDFRLSIKVDSLSTVSYFYCGLLLYDSSKYTESISFLNDAINTKGSDTLFFEVNSDFVNCGQREPVKMSEILFFRGLCYLYLNRITLAINDLSYSVNQGYNLKKSYYYLGLAYKSEKKNLKACKYFLLAKQNGNADVDSLDLENCR